MNWKAVGKFLIKYAPMLIQTIIQMKHEEEEEKKKDA